MQVRDVITRKVISATVGDSILAAARLMLQNRISGLPVVDAGGHLVGVVTEGDFLRRSELGTQRSRPKWLEFLLGPGRLANEYVHAFGRKVDEIMTADPICVTEDDSLQTVVELMERGRVKRLPVIRDGLPCRWFPAPGCGSPRHRRPALAYRAQDAAPRRRGWRG
jgi:CBS domain-containing protein